MKQQKHAGLIGLSEKKSCKIKNKFLNNKGVTLAELMVTVAIGAIVSLSISTVFVFAMQQFTVLVEKNTAEESALMISYYLRNYLSQAVDLNAAFNVSPADLALAGGTGVIDVNFDLLGAGSGIANPNDGRFAEFAVFNREAGTYNTNMNVMANGGSDLRPTGIFLKDTDPNGVNPDARSGAIVFDINSTGAMMPTASDLVFSRLHNFNVQRVTCGGVLGYAVEVVVTSPVAAENGRLLTCVNGTSFVAGRTYKIKTITLEVATRYYRTADKENWNYRFPVGGGNTASYRDIVQTVKINFKNNVLTTESLTGDSGSEVRVHGSLYFYDYFLPANRN